MKFRKGFVSNSSSSSFVLVITKSAHERIMSRLHDYVKAVIEEMEPKEDIFMGSDVLAFSTFSDQGGYGTFDDISPEYEGEIPIGEWDDEMSPYEAWDVYKEEAKKEKGCYS